MTSTWETCACAAALAAFLTTPAPAAGEDARPYDARAAAIARERGVPERTVLRLLRDKGMGYDDVDRLLDVAGRAQVPLVDVLKLRGEGKSWSRIEKSYGLAPGRRTPPPARAAAEALGRMGAAARAFDGERAPRP